MTLLRRLVDALRRAVNHFLHPQFCPVDHCCVCCGRLVLEAARHQARGRSNGNRCEQSFNVRCHVCKALNKVPDPIGWKGWWDESRDSRRVFHEEI